MTWAPQPRPAKVCARCRSDATPRKLSRAGKLVCVNEQACRRRCRRNQLERRRRG